MSCTKYSGDKEEMREPHLNARIVETTHNTDNTLNIKLECDCGSAWYLRKCYIAAWEFDSSEGPPLEEVTFVKKKGLSLENDRRKTR